MNHFEIYCQIQQYFMQIQKQCIIICFKFSGKYENCSDVIGDVYLKCVNWMKMAKRHCYGARVADIQGIGFGEMQKVLGQTLRLQGDFFKNQDSLENIFVDAYRPNFRKGYINEFPSTMFRAEFGDWKSGENPYAGLQSIVKRAKRERALGNVEVCTLFYEIRKILFAEYSWEILSRELRKLFLQYGIEL